MEPREPKTEKPLSNRERAAIKDELISELVAGCQNEADLFGPEGVFTRLKGAVMQRLLEAEMTAHLGHEPHERRKGSHSRNGHSVKTITTETGPVSPATARAPSNPSW
jgi:transposase-like protein